MKEDSDLSSFLGDLMDNSPLEPKNDFMKNKKYIYLEWVILDLIRKVIRLDYKEIKDRDDLAGFFVNLEKTLLYQFKERKNLE